MHKLHDFHKRTIINIQDPAERGEEARSHTVMAVRACTCMLRLVADLSFTVRPKIVID